MMNLRKSVYIHVEIIAFMVGYFRSTVSQTDKSAPANISGNFTLKCPFTYNSTWERVYWKIKNQTIFTFNARTNATEKNGDEKRYKSSNHGSHLTITEIEKSDEGSYFCKVSTHDDRILIGGPFRLSVTDQERETFPTVPRITSPQATSPHFDKRWLIIPSVIVLVIIIIVIICFLKRKCSLCGIRQKPRRTSRQKPYAPVDGTADSEVNGNCSPGSSEQNNQPLMLHVGQNRTTSRGLDPSPDPSHLDSSPLSFHSCRDFSVGDDASIEGDSSDRPGEDLNVSHALGDDTGRPEEGLNGSHASVQGNNPPGNTDLSPISEESAIDSGLGSSFLRTSSTPSSSNCPTYSQVLSPAESSNCSNLLESMLMDFSRPSGTSSTTSSFSWNYSKVVSPQGTTTTLMVSSHQGTPSSVPNPDSTQVSIPQGTISSDTVSSPQRTLILSSVPNTDCTQVAIPQGTISSDTVSSHQGTLTPSSVPNSDSTQVSIPQGTISSDTVSSQQGALTPSSVPNSDCTQEINAQSDYDREIEDDNVISFLMSKVLKCKGKKSLERKVLDQLGELDQDPQSACQDGAEKRSTKKDYIENVTGNKINRNTKQEDTEMAPKKEILNSYKPKNNFPTSEG